MNDGRDPTVERHIDILGGLIFNNRRFWVGAGNFETRVLGDALEGIEIRAPIHICGLARSGSTVLLEILAAQRDTATHRYRDFPALYTPYWWNWFLDHMPRRQPGATERAHRDGLMVTADSPEAMEEPLWMTFFPDAHDARLSSVLDATTNNPPFERFYRDHIRKLLLVRGGTRYVAKGNYNVTRMAYLRRLFPDIRFVVPVREPASHIASLIKQHALFSRRHGEDPRTREHMRRAGHFEFGLDRRPINTGDATRDIAALWAGGDEVAGWARHWSHVYGHVADRLDADAGLRAATLVVRYEDLCDAPAATIARLFDHCGLAASDAYSGRIAAPSYYRPDLSNADRALIRDVTESTAQRFGY